MTAIKRCCALALAVLMILTALPVTAFAETAAHETNASLHETTLDGIANDITRQVLLQQPRRTAKESRWKTPPSSTTAMKSRSSWW